MRQKAVHQCRMIGLAAAAAVLVFSVSTTLRAQDVGSEVPPDYVYQLSYFSNAHAPVTVPPAPDATLRLVNDGLQGDTSPTGDLCASIYVFDANEEMKECCSCLITPNGLLTLSVNTNLTNHGFTGGTVARGVIKVISTAPAADACTPAPGAGTPVALTTSAGIHGWITHIQHPGASFAQTEEELTPAALSAPEALDLSEDCATVFPGAPCSCVDARR